MILSVSGAAQALADAAGCAGVVYVIRNDESKYVYIGQTSDLYRRLLHHASRRTSAAPLFEVETSYVAVVLASDDLRAIATGETAVRNDYLRRGWTVLSGPGGGIRPGRLAGLASGSKGGKARFARMQADPAFDVEMRAASGRGGKAGGAIGVNARDRRRREDPEYDAEWRRKIREAAQRRKKVWFSCGTCGLRSNAGALVVHQKSSGHTGRNRLT